MKSIYELELIEILKVWVFNFLCPNCMKEDSPALYRYISPVVDADDNEGIYASSPTIWCGCNEMLYSIKSHGLYDLLDSLFERDPDTKKYIIISIEVIQESKDEEVFDYSIES